MPDTDLKKSFIVAGRQVNTREHCFALGFIAQTTGAADALKAVFDQDIPVQRKSDISTALHGLDEFIRQTNLGQRIKTLGDFLESDLLAYIQSIPAHRKTKRERDRATLRYFFTQMVERGVITQDQHPVPIYRGGITPKADIDAFWGEASSPAHQAMVDFFNTKHPNWNNLKLSRTKRGRLHYVTASANFASYAKRHGVMRAQDVSAEFALTYLMTFKQGDRKISPRRQTQTLLRHIFEHRITARLHGDENPFTGNLDNPRNSELMIINPLYLASGSDAAIGNTTAMADKVKTYLADQSKHSTQPVPAIDQFCFWLIHWRGTTRLDAITRDDVLDYWGHILSGYPQRTARNYFTPILDFLRHIGRPVDRAIHIDKRKRVKKPSRYSTVPFADIWRYYRKQHPSLIKRGMRHMTHHYVLEQLSNLPFKEQLHIAVFVQYYSRCKIPPAELVGGYVLKLHHMPGARTDIGGSYLRAGATAGFTITCNGKQHLSKEFADMLCAPDAGILNWASQIIDEQKRRIQPMIKRVTRELKARNELG